MKDIVSKIARAKSLADIEKSIAEEGRISDETRRELVRRFPASKLPAKDRQAGYELVMGSLSSVLNEARCIDWWEAVSGSEDAVRAAVARKLPFKQSVIQEFSRAEILTKLLTKGEHSIAWCIWSEAMDDTSRAEMLDDMLHLISREDIPHEDVWLEDVIGLVSRQGMADRMGYMAAFFCDKFLRKSEMKGVDAALAASFPQGLSGEQASNFIAKLAELSGGRVAEMEDCARQMLKPLRAIANHLTLDTATPASQQPTPSRRI